jgi:spermidine synthase
VNIASTLRSVFPSVYVYQTYMPSFGSMWGFALAGSQIDPLSWTVEEVDRQISARISKDLKFYDGVAHHGLFFLPKNLREDIERGGAIVTDEKPAFLFY